MKGICIYIPLKAYVAEWLTFHLGNPVKLPARSYESILLGHLLSRRPRTAGRFKHTGTPIVIPDNDRRRPEYFNYLSIPNQRIFTKALDNLFLIHLWSSCLPLVYQYGKLNNGIDEWCKANGISFAHREAVRKRFYRLRAEYYKDGIIVGMKRKRQSKEYSIV